MSKIRFAVLGCGKICHRFIKGLQMTENGLLVGFGATSLNRAKEYADNYNVSIYGTYDDILKRDDIDAVYVSNYNPGHFELVSNALKHHKHVLCEKPMVATMEKYNALYQLADENGCMLMEAFKGVFLPMNEYIKYAVNNGMLGKISYIHASYCYNGMFPKNHWIYEEESGGCLQDVGSYPSSVVNFILGNKKADKITKIITNYNGVAGFAEVIAQYGDLQVHLNSSIICGTENYIEIYGDNGKIKAENYWKGSSLDLTLYNQKETVKKTFELKSDFYYETQHFIKCIKCAQTQSDIVGKAFTENLVKLMDYNNY